MPGPLPVGSVGLFFAGIVALVAFVLGSTRLARLEGTRPTLPWPSRMLSRPPTEEDPPILCAICQRPIPLGRGRYRTAQGDVHEECYQEQRDKRERSP
jgi:hypothetical protein